MKTNKAIYQPFYKMSNGSSAYDIRIAAQILNHNEIGRNNLLYHLRGLNLLDRNNCPTKEYEKMFLIEKINVTTKKGYNSEKVVISDAGLRYFEENDIYGKIRELDKIYCESFEKRMAI